MKTPQKRHFLKHLIFFLLTSIVLIWLTYPFLLAKMADFLEVSDPLEKADAILVLGGEKGERVFCAARLYQKGFAPYVIMSGGRLTRKYPAADFMKEDAEDFGVPSQAILLETKALSTFDNAVLSLPLLKEHGFKSVIVVTSPYHSRRSALVFKKRYSKEKIKVIMRSVIPNKFTSYKKDKWWTCHKDAKTVVREWMGLFYYFLRGYF